MTLNIAMKNGKNRHAMVYLHSSEAMPEIQPHEAKLMVGASVYLGKGVPWPVNAKLYDQVYHQRGCEILAGDGVLVVLQTNAYEDGKFLCKYYNLCKLLFGAGWELIDERVWERRAADHYQVPFSHILVFRPPGGTAKRNTLNKRSKAWFQGVWRYKQVCGGELNAYPDGLCKLIVEACTDPGDLIVDPFAGTGRLLGWAARLGRKAIGYEINKELIPTLVTNGCYVQEGKRLHRTAVAAYKFIGN